MNKQSALENIPDTLLVEWGKQAVQKYTFLLDIIDGEVITDEDFGKLIKIDVKTKTLAGLNKQFYFGEYGLLDKEENEYELYSEKNLIAYSWLLNVSKANLGHTIKGKSFNAYLEDKQIDLLLLEQERLVRQVCDKIAEKKETTMTALQNLNCNSLPDRETPID